MSIEKKCLKCGKPMNPVEYLMGCVCGKCCRENHKKAIEIK
jgi:hypothetical protein